MTSLFRVFFGSICVVSSFAAEIKGVVQDPQGKGVPQAFITLNMRPTSADVKPFNTSTTTSADGTFSAPSLPAGSYLVCAQAPQTNLLSPCTWEGMPTPVNVTAEQVLTIAPIRMKSGVRLVVRVNDPSGARAAAEGKEVGASLFIVAKGPQGFAVPVTIARKDAAGVDHEVLIPEDTDLEVSISSRTFNVSNDKGAPILANDNAVIPVKVPKGSAPQQVVLTVTGRKG